MKICKNYSVSIIEAFSFSKDKNENTKCYSETKHQNIKNSELSFGEILHKAMNNRK